MGGEGDLSAEVQERELGNMDSVSRPRDDDVTWWLPLPIGKFKLEKHFEQAGNNGISIASNPLDDHVARPPTPSTTM